jgi:hypothetical protein
MVPKVIVKDAWYAGILIGTIQAGIANRYWARSGLQNRCHTKGIIVGGPECWSAPDFAQLLYF